MFDFRPIQKALKYAATLPERTLRSLAAGIGGSSKFLTDTLLPSSLRGTRFYRFFLGNTQRFLIEQVGDVKGAFENNDEKLTDDYLSRKVVGNVVDYSAIFSVHFSPLWFFALMGDAAEGTQTYLNKIVEELKKDGLLSKETKIRSTESLLEALQEAASQSALPFDTPPLSKKDVQNHWKEIQEGYRNLYESSKEMLPSPKNLWDLLIKVKEKEKLPLLHVIGGVSLKSAMATGKATGSLFYEKVLLSYREGLEEISKEGYAAFLSRVSEPYVQAILGAFSPTKKTWTEKFFGRWKKVR